jgi:Tfp pilus assembly protein PilF
LTRASTTRKHANRKIKKADDKQAARLHARIIDESGPPEIRDLNTFIDLANYLGNFDAAEEYARLALTFRRSTNSARSIFCWHGGNTHRR